MRKWQRVTKKWVAMLLTLTMCMSLISAPAFADDVEDFDASAGQVIEIPVNVTDISPAPDSAETTTSTDAPALDNNISTDTNAGADNNHISEDVNVGADDNHVSEDANVDADDNHVSEDENVATNDSDVSEDENVATDDSDVSEDTDVSSDDSHVTGDTDADNSGSKDNDIDSIDNKQSDTNLAEKENEEGQIVKEEEAIPKRVQSFLDAVQAFVQAVPETVSEEDMETLMALSDSCWEAYDALDPNEDYEREDVLAALSNFQSFMEKIATLAEKENGVISVSTADGLKKALSEQADECTLRLENDVTISERLTVTGTVTLDLNGYTLTYANQPNQNNDSLFLVQGGTFTITDTGANGSSNSERVINYQVMLSKANSDGTTTETIEDRSINLTTVGSITIANEIFTEFDKNLSAIVIVDNGGNLILQKGVIDGNDFKARGILVKSGHFQMQGGGIYHCAVNSYGNPHGGGVCIENGTMIMTDGIIAENGTENIYYRGSGVTLEKGSLDITGGAIVNNKAGVGGGIYAKDGSGEITIRGNAVIAGNDSTSYGYGGGIAVEDGSEGNYTLRIQDNALITKNRAGSWGGGIWVGFKNCPLFIEGGQITGNENGAKEQWYGGGIYAQGSPVTMAGGIIANNSTPAGGGGIAITGGGSLTIEDGYISNNIAGSQEGGGIRIDGSRLKITGGYITNNKTETSEHWGGGGIFISDGSKAEIRNLLVTDNTAGGLGGGVAGCSTGQLAIATTEGLASYNNTAQGLNGSGDASAKRQDQAALNSPIFKTTDTEGNVISVANDYYCAHTSYVSDGMLGGGSANWEGAWDNNHDYTTTDTGCYAIEAAPLTIPIGGAAAAAHVMGLTAYPSAEDIDKAQRAAKVFITGNHSNTHGGGIMCNGVLFIGAISDETTKVSSITLEAEKIYQNADGTARNLLGNEFTFDLVKADDFHIEDGKINYVNAISAQNDQNGKIIFNVSNPSDIGTHTYYLVERAGQDSHITYDPAIYQITVNVDTSKEISWQIDTKLTVTIYTGEVTKVTEMSINENGELVEKAKDLTKETSLSSSESIESKAVFTNIYTPSTIPTKPTDPTEPIDPGSPDEPSTSDEPPTSTTPDTPTYAPNVPIVPVTELPNTEVPLAELPEEDIPLAAIPEVEEPLIELPEDEVPLADVPKTGDGSISWLLAALMSGLAWLGLSRRKEER